jgi:hypothetical protein
MVDFGEWGGGGGKGGEGKKEGKGVMGEEKEWGAGRWNVTSHVGEFGR